MAWKVQKRQVLDTQVSSATSYHHGEVSLVKVGGLFCGWTVVADVWASQINMESILNYFGTPESWRWFGIGRWFSFKNEVTLGFLNVNLTEQMSNDKNPWSFRVYLG